MLSKNYLLLLLINAIEELYNLYKHKLYIISIVMDFVIVEIKYKNNKKKLSTLFFVI